MKLIYTKTDAFYKCLPFSIKALPSRIRELLMETQSDPECLEKHFEP
jgi:hypothetical protein